MKRLLKIVAVTVVAAAVYGGYLLKKPTGPWQHPYVPPHENADGTIDYTLVDKPRRESDGSYWILRFPKEWDVVPSEAEDPGAVQLPNGTVVDFNSVPNDHVKINFDYQTLTPMKKGERLKDNEDLRLIARGNPRLFLSKEQLETLRRETEQNCNKIGEPLVGVVEYEVRKPEREHNPGCFVGWLVHATFTGYLIFDEARNYIAEFNCTDPSEGQLYVCSGSIELSNKFTAQFGFRTPQKIMPAKLKEITFFARDFFEKSTVKILKLKPDEQFEFPK
jgi:hypothetical protein